MSQDKKLYGGSDLARSVATTASVLVNSTQAGGGLNGSHSVLVSNRTFQRAVGETLHSNRNQSLMQKHAGPGVGAGFGVPLVRRSKMGGRSKKGFASIPDQLLSQLGDEEPELDGTQFSLFQGFSAVLPEVEETLERIQDGSVKLLTSDKTANNPLPKGVTPEKIRTSQSPQQLRQFKDDINYKLDLIEIRKGLASHDIRELDAKIERLYEQRKGIFDRIAQYEQNESFLEEQLGELEARLAVVKDVAGVDEANEASEADEVAVVDETDDERLSNDENSADEAHQNALLSQSIYGKLVQSERTKTKRKHKPTLQQYYSPGSKISEFKAHVEAVTCFGFDAPYGTLVSASLDNTVRVWDLSKNRCRGLLEGHLSSVRCLQMQDQLVLTGSMDASLRLWNLEKVGTESDALVASFESHVDEVTALSFNADNGTMVSGSQDRTIRQWDMNTGRCLQTIDVLWASSMMNIGGGGVAAASTEAAWKQYNDTQYPFIGALQCYDAALASGTADGIVRLWDLRSGEVIRQLIGHTGPVTCLQFDDRNLTTGSADRSIRIWDLRTGGILDSFAYDSPIQTLQFDASRIVSTNGENTVKIYDRIEERHWDCGRGVDEDTAAVVSYARYQEGYLVEGRLDGTVGVWAI